MNENMIFTSEMFEDAEKYWKNKLSGELIESNLLSDYPGSDQYAGANYKISFENQIAKELMRISKNNNLLLNVILLTIFKILLYKLTGQNDVIVSSPVLKTSNQNYNKYVALRDVLIPGMTFKDLLMKVKETVIDGYKYQYYPIRKLIKLLKIENRLCLFKFIFLLDNVHDREFVVDIINNADNDIIFSVNKNDESLEGELTYNANLFKEETIQRLSDWYTRILTGVLNDTNTKISEISTITEEEKKKILVDFNNSRTEYPKDKTLHQLYDQEVKQKNDHIVIVEINSLRPDGIRCISYGELSERANQLAIQLKNRGAAPGSIISLMIGHCIDLMAAILGVLKAGCVYLPLDPDYPGDRINYMLKDSSSRLLLISGDLTARCEGIEFAGEIIEISETGEYKIRPYKGLPGERRGEPCVHPAFSDSRLERLTTPGDPVYVIYTSGSTGKPKGVIVEHRNVVRLVKNMNYIHFSDKDRMLPTGAIAFDISTFELWGPLLNGVRLYFVDEPIILDAEKLAKVISQHEITILHLIPQLFNQMSTQTTIFAGLKYLLVGGDIVRPRYINEVRNKHKNLKILQMYGPTENTTFTTSFPVDKDYEFNIPIGKPVSNSTVYILGSLGQIQPVGIVGELCTGGDGVARGYLNNPELTAERFICLRPPGGRFLKKLPPWTPRKNFLLEGTRGLAPLLSKGTDISMQSCNHASMPKNYHFSHFPISPFPHCTIYFTGDLARWLPDGNIEFIGRRDNQVKIRGYRIELGEIESVLSGHEKIQEAIIITKEDEEKNPYLCAYFTAEEKIDTSELRKYLSQRLPDYMLPLFFVPLQEIQLTPNGKIDRKALPEPEVAMGDEYTAPRDEVEKKLVEIWAEVLRVEKDVISIDSNFFKLGGHSLKAAVLISKLHKAFDVKIPLAELWKAPFIKELAQYVKEKGVTPVEERFSSIEPVEKKEYYPLSSAQRRLYVLQQMNLDSTSYNIPITVLLEGVLDKEKLEKSFRELIQRHQSLRTSFELINEESVQRIYDEVEFKIEYYDMKEIEVKVEDKDQRTEDRGQKTEDRRPKTDNGQQITEVKTNTYLSSVIRHLSSEFIRPFDLSRAPLMRVGLIHTPRPLRVHPSQEGSFQDKYILMADVHHIVTDGTSMDLLVKEFMVLYSGGELPPLRLQYKDYSKWQKGSGKRPGESIKEQEEYWVKQFEGEPPLLNLPTDYPRPAVKSFAGSSLDFQLSLKQTRGLNDLALNTETSLFMLLLAIYNILLSKISGQEDMIVGTPVAARRHVDLEKIIGMFVNTLAIRTFVPGMKTFIQYLQDVKGVTLNAFEKQDYPFEDLVEKAAVERDTSRNPLFDVMFVMQNITRTPGKIGKEGLGGLKLKPYALENKTAKFDLVLFAVEEGEKVNFFFEYCTKLFEKETIIRWVNYYKRIISSLIENPHMAIWEIDILAEEEKKQLLYDFNDTETAYPKKKTIHRLFTDQANKTPDRTAVIGMARDAAESCELTYRELTGKSDQLAHLLREKGIKTDTVVGITAERTVEMVVGILGILKAGGAYLPIDPDYPQERINYMLKDAKVKILVENSKSFCNSAIGDNIDAIFIDDVIHKNCPQDTSIPPSTLLPFYPSSLSSLAYVIYTSGSSGKPKGVLVEHAPVVNLVICQEKRFDINEGDRVLQFSSLCFDASVEQIFMAFSSGAVLVLVDKNTLLDIDKFEKFITTQSITHLHAIPSFLSNIRLNNNYNIKRFIAGGDVCPPALAKKWSPYCDFYNKYGPTETTVTSIETMIAEVDETLPRLPIGKPVDNTVVYLLDKWMMPVPKGTTGELYLGGEGLARGYLNNPELTAEKFCLRRPGGRFSAKGDRCRLQVKVELSETSSAIKPSLIGPPCHGAPWTPRKNFLLFPHFPIPPFPHYPIYQTGDLARWLKNGDLDFIGRIDQQVKIRGYRIELGEIESKLLNIKSIKEAIVIDRKDQAGESSLCAYLVCEEEPDIPGLRNLLAKDLPGYMIPSYFMQIEHIPLNPNGKVNRKALPAPKAISGPGYIAPRNKVEKKLVKIWSEVLNISHDVIGIDSDFFHLGGHSLKAMRLAVRINKELDVKMPLLEIFKQPFIRSLSQYVKEAKPGKYEFLEAVEKKEYYPLTAAQQGIYVQHQKERGRSAYSIPHTMLLDINIDIKRLEKTFKKLIQRHESLRTSFQLLGGNPVQRVHDEVKFEIEYYDMKEVKVKVDDYEGTGGLAPLPNAPLSIEPAARSSQPAADLISSFIRPFDLAQPPLIRVGIIETDQAYILLLDMHHIITDGVSTEMTAKDFMSLYNGEQCLPLRIGCKDYSIWQNRPGIIEKRKKQGESWLKEYQGNIPVLDMPYDYQRPAQRSFEGGWVRFAINREITGKLKEMSRQTGTTLYMILLAAFYILLSKYARQEDIIVGTPVNGRNHPDLENIIGLFINMLAIRNKPGRNKTFKRFLMEVKEKVLKAFENQDYQFKELLMDLGLQGDVRRNPLFDVVFSMAVPNLEKTGKDDDKPGDYNELKTFVRELKYKITPFDMILGALESNEIIEITIAYATALYKQSTIEKMGEYFTDILRQAADNYDIKLQDIRSSRHLIAVSPEIPGEDQEEFKF